MTADDRRDAMADPIDTAAIRDYWHRAKTGQPLSYGYALCDEVDRLRLMLDAAETGAESRSGDLARLRAENALADLIDAAEVVATTTRLQATGKRVVNEDNFQTLREALAALDGDHG